VVVFNANSDVAELLTARINAAGFVALVMHVAEIRAGVNMAEVIARHNPAVVVYDIEMPYDRNWRFFEHLRDKALKDRPVVITTPNEAGVRKLLGKNDKAYEVLDDGPDVDSIVEAVREAVKARSDR
jgi:CheY-like chemotaxis protein